MKKILLIGAICSIGLMSSACCNSNKCDGNKCAKDVTAATSEVTVATLPEAVGDVVKANFADKQIARIDTEKKGDNIKYEINFTDGTELEVYADGSLSEVDCRNEAVPAALVPETIASYVTTNYPGVKIVKLEVERRGYEAELSNKVDLHFDAQGAFIRSER